jgi:hypothetical protein
MTSATDVPADAREQLYNDRRIGPVEEVQLPAERVTTLHGFLLELDPRLYLAGNSLCRPDDDPRTFYANIKPVLARHALALTP